MVTKQNIKNILKKSLICSLSMFTILSLSNCSKGPNKNYIDNAIAIVYQDKKPYLINAEKETYSLDYYDEVVEIFNEYIAVKKDGKYGFINRTGKLIIEPIYDKVYPMYEEKAVVIKDGQYEIIDNTGKSIYIFSNNVISESYFSENFLLINKDDKYGFLKYNPDTKSFESSEIIYDYAKSFKESYAVVGIYPEEIIYKKDDEGNITEEIEEIRLSESLKYNYVNNDFKLLFDEFTYDYADDFSNGYAIVGNYDDIFIPTVGQINAHNPGVNDYEFTKENTLVYKYITVEKTSLHFDYEYVFKYFINNGREEITEEKHYTDEVYLPYVQSFTTDLTFVAKYRYSTIQTPLKEYMLVSTTGKMDYTLAVYEQTQYKFGYDTNHKNAKNYQCQSPSLFSVGKVVKINDTYAFIAGQTLTSPNWKVYYLQYSFYENDYLFKAVTWDVIKEVANEDGTTTEIVPEWGLKYKADYLKNTTSNVTLKHAIENPYEMTDLSISKYYSSDCLINTIRMNKSDKYGLVRYDTGTIYYEKYDDSTNLLTASFVLDPIYDKIIY